jgi:metallo-beta-lactamase class B
VAAYWGGTAFNWVTNRAGYITPERPDASGSAATSTPPSASASWHRRRRDVLLSNHTAFDGSKTKLPALATRKPSDPHPYVIGTSAVGRYLTVAEECAKAGLLRVP